ncbi:hypothetical protein D3C72_1893800 [compost metagenome]
MVSPSLRVAPDRSIDQYSAGISSMREPVSSTVSSAPGRSLVMPFWPKFRGVMYMTALPVRAPAGTSTSSTPVEFLKEPPLAASTFTVCESSFLTVVSTSALSPGFMMTRSDEKT